MGNDLLLYMLMEGSLNMTALFMTRSMEVILEHSFGGRYFAERN